MLTCKRCGATWFQRSSNLPLRCPKCKSTQWNGPSRRDCPYCQACPDHGHPPIGSAGAPAVTALRVPGLAEPVPSRCPAKDTKRREFTDIELAEIIHHEFTPPIDRQMTTADRERMREMQAMYAHDDVPRRPRLSDEEVDRIFGSSSVAGATETGK